MTFLGYVWDLELHLVAFLLPSLLGETADTLMPLTIKTFPLARSTRMVLTTPPTTTPKACHYRGLSRVVARGSVSAVSMCFWGLARESYLILRAVLLQTARGLDKPGKNHPCRSSAPKMRFNRSLTYTWRRGPVS